MEWIKNLKIDKKLTVLIAIGLILGAVIGFIGIGALNECKKSENNLIYLGIKPQELIANTYQLVQANRADTYKYILSKNPGDRAEIRANMLKRYDDIAENIEKYSKKDNEAKTKSDMETMTNNVAECKKLRLKVLGLAAQGKTTEAYALIDVNAKNVQAILDFLDNLEASVQNTTSELANNFSKTANSAITFLIIAMIVTIAVLSILGKMISDMITKPIKQAIDGLNIGTEEVSAASSQVAAASQQLAEGTSEQAASVQETSSTLEETSSMVHQNRENTQQASTLAKQAKSYAEKSNIEMGKMMNSMGDLKNSSNEIAKIIKVIDEIAFQTNILSLNAAVEAARAGDAGKGFAVVAEEVRNLAQRSAQAAKETAVIIESNVNLSEEGVDIAKAVKDSVESIGEQATKVSDLLEEISVATNEQAQGVEQINKAVSQMEVVLHTNAQTAEEAASASQALSEQAINVKEIVNTLMVLVDGADALRAQPQRQRALAGNPPRHIGGGQARKKIATSSYSQSPKDIIPLGDGF